MGGGVCVWVGDGVDVATKVEVGEGVSVWVGEAVDVAEASDARDVGVKVPSPAGVSRQPASPRTTNDARAIARYCRAKILPTVVERGVKRNGSRLIRLKASLANATGDIDLGHPKLSRISPIGPRLFQEIPRRAGVADGNCHGICTRIY